MCVRQNLFATTIFKFFEFLKKNKRFDSGIKCVVGVVIFHPSENI